MKGHNTRKQKYRKRYYLFNAFCILVDLVIALVIVGGTHLILTKLDGYISINSFQRAIVMLSSLIVAYPLSVENTKFVQDIREYYSER